ncbi:hypothetical protein LI142_10900 [Eubacterium limosum]|uniref:hypothetical protein n=1 Tax=Eubacterium limosum TaxID=1736 RepID=UPI001D06F971|nr:hypothetical protein [Eubacterium limosum]MCB6570007.1 hypothetical protein [Eubacterium limosum]
MEKNYIPEVARMLGVEIGEEFDILDENGDARGWNSHKFTKEMMVNCMGGEARGWLVYYLLTGEYTLQKRPWRPKEGEGYYYIRSTDGFLSRSTFHNVDADDLALLNMGNCFPSKDAAEAAVPEMLAKFEEIKKGETCHIEDECCCKKEKMTECKMEYEDMMNALEKAARSSNVLSGNDEQQVLEFISELRYSEAGWGVWDDID